MKNTEKKDFMEDIITQCKKHFTTFKQLPLWKKVIIFGTAYYVYSTFTETEEEGFVEKFKELLTAKNGVIAVVLFYIFKDDFKS